MKRTTVAGADAATGLVVVIDVLRAFTAAACALHAGARDILLVETVEEALRLRDLHPGSLLMGEVRGDPIPGFDFGNSPAALIDARLEGRRMIQRTSNGTRGVVRSRRADTLLAASFVCAAATACWIGQTGPRDLTFVITGAHEDADGDEDSALADYLEARLHGSGPPDPQPFLRRIPRSVHGRRFARSRDPRLQEDLRLCGQLDLFDFAMPIVRDGDLLVLSAVPVQDDVRTPPE